jgi:hypothetical protein
MNFYALNSMTTVIPELMPSDCDVRATGRKLAAGVLAEALAL